MWFFASASIQTMFPFRIKGGNERLLRLRTLCLRISCFLPCALRLSSAPPCRRSIRSRVGRKFGGVTAAAGSGVFPRGTCETDRQSSRFATWLHLPRSQTPPRVESPPAFHSLLCKFDISFPRKLMKSRLIGKN